MAKKSGGTWIGSAIAVVLVIVGAALFGPKLFASTKKALANSGAGSKPNDSPGGGFLSKLGDALTGKNSGASSGRPQFGGSTPASGGSLLGKGGMPLFASPAAQQKFIRAAGGGQGPQVVSSEISGTIPYQVDTSISQSDLRPDYPDATPPDLADILAGLFPTGPGTLESAYDYVGSVLPDYGSYITLSPQEEVSHNITDTSGNPIDDLSSWLGDVFGFGGSSSSDSVADYGTEDDTGTPSVYAAPDLTGYDYEELLSAYGDYGDQVFYY